MELCALHEGSKSEREESFHLVMHKLNTFEMFLKENANEMYSRLNVIVEELNGLGLNKLVQWMWRGRYYASSPLKNMGT